MLTPQEIYATKRSLMRIPFKVIADAIGKNVNTVLGTLGKKSTQHFSEETAKQVYQFIDAHQTRLLHELARLDILKD
ncbi:MAG TPA: hypothetical protein VGM92_01230 [Candidatus Kapabacteria bacterium]